MWPLQKKSNQEAARWNHSLIFRPLDYPRVKGLPQGHLRLIVLVFKPETFRSQALSIFGGLRYMFIVPKSTNTIINRKTWSRAASSKRMVLKGICPAFAIKPVCWHKKIIKQSVNQWVATRRERQRGEVNEATTTKKNVFGLTFTKAKSFHASRPAGRKQKMKALVFTLFRAVLFLTSIAILFSTDINRL